MFWQVGMDSNMMKTEFFICQSPSFLYDSLAPKVIRLEFRNERGSVVEEVKVYETELEKYKKVDALFDLARRKATNADETIDRILEQLNKGSIAA
jgi:hypothetical protein